MGRVEPKANLPEFDGADVRAMDAGPVCQLLLRNPAILPTLANYTPECDAEGRIDTLLGWARRHRRIVDEQSTDGRLHPVHLAIPYEREDSHLVAVLYREVTIRIAYNPPKPGRISDRAIAADVGLEGHTKPGKREWVSARGREHAVAENCREARVWSGTRASRPAARSPLPGRGRLAEISCQQIVLPVPVLQFEFLDNALNREP